MRQCLPDNWKGFNQNSLLDAIYKQWPPAALPVEALDQVAAGLGRDISAEWLEFCERYAGGAITYNGTNTRELTQQQPAVTSTLNQTDQVNRTVSWFAPDLMAKLYRFKFNFAWPNDRPLKISLPEGRRPRNLHWCT